IRYASALAGGTEERRVVVNRFAQCVGSLQEVPLAALILGGEYQAVVVGVADVFASADGAESRVRVELLVWRLAAEPGWIPHNHAGLILIHKQAQLVDQ